MKLYADPLTLPGALPQGTDPQPVFRDPAQDRVLDPAFLPAAAREGFGRACAARVLPYRMQNRYAGALEPVTVKTLVLENEFLRAVFLPGFGGRLWSLFDKEQQREVLFRNPVLRPRNLAVRNAWVAGGIEWNLGHTGHSVFTCGDLFCRAVTAPDGERFLRMYEYEAIEGQVLQMDFHLPDGARQLAVYVRIENAENEARPLYWWTNTAVRLTPGTRVFSGTRQILYQRWAGADPTVYTFGESGMPAQPNLPGVELSYPARIPRSLEYFFQNSRTEPAPWEVGAAEDGRGFFERSTQPLFARKLFCWGNGRGGRHWCAYLSQPGEGDYVELQAGLAPTQLHTAAIAPRAAVGFTQIFGAFSAPADAVQGPWGEAMPRVQARVEALLPAAEVRRLDREYAQKALYGGGEALHDGGAYGGLERARRKGAGEADFAPQLDFPPPAPQDPASCWLPVLRGGQLPEMERPAPYCTSAAWLPLLERAAASAAATRQTKFQLAVSLAENGQEARAVPLLRELAQQGDCWAQHALGSLAARHGDWPRAADSLAAAWRLEQNALDASFARDAMAALAKAGRWQALWQLWDGLPVEKRTEEEELLAAEAAVKLENFAFFEACVEKDYACIREGAAGLAEAWWEYRARLRCRQEGAPFSPDQIDRTLPLPEKLDFQMGE